MSWTVFRMAVRKLQWVEAKNFSLSFVSPLMPSTELNEFLIIYCSSTVQFNVLLNCVKRGVCHCLGAEKRVSHLLCTLQCGRPRQHTLKLASLWFWLRRHVCCSLDFDSWHLRDNCVSWACTLLWCPWIWDSAVEHQCRHQNKKNNLFSIFFLRFKMARQYFGKWGQRITSFLPFCSVSTLADGRVKEMCVGRLFFKWQLDLSQTAWKMHRSHFDSFT